VLEGVRSFDDVRFTTYRHTYLRNWCRGRLLFVGDAAHAMSPHLGQGVNLALQDAEQFVRAVDQHRTWPHAASAYRQARVNVIRYYSTITAMLTPFFQSRGWIKGLGRDVLLPHMARIGPIRHLMLRSLSGR
jgi:2-polyprenyl-6-methoxyphenol hydroxylase-like FAD-dependent oxidoreductase